jgi:hypothetical protein
MDIDRYLSRTVFVADIRGSNPLKGRYERKTAAELGFKEEWLQRAVAEDVELALSPCREGGLIGPKDKEKWVLWGKEVSVRAAGGITIDVLILSEFGRIGIIETKLAYNPEARREVVAQVLEYAVHLPSMAVEDLPPIPIVNSGKPLVDRDTIEKKISEDMIYGWDLALVEVAVFEQIAEPGKKEYLLVPHLIGVVAVEQRNVVRVIIEENRTRVNVEQTPGPVTVNRQKWDEEKFFTAAEGAHQMLRDFTERLKRLRDKYSGITFDFGTSKDGTLIFRKKGNNILEFGLGYGGNIRFRDYFDDALGEDTGRYYRQQLACIFPEPMKQAYPYAAPPKFNPDTAAQLLELLEEVLIKSSSG